MSTINTTNLKNPSSGSNHVVLNADGSAHIATLSGTTITGTSVRGGITSGTAVASTSGTSIDFTGIPSWVKRITVMFSGVSTNGTSHVLIQIGTSSGVTTTGYLGAGTLTASSSVTSYFTTGFGIHNAYGATEVTHGCARISLLNQSTNLWAADGVLALSAGTNAATKAVAGTVTLSGTLDRVRITTVNGTDTFDAGTVNILYEG